MPKIILHHYPESPFAEKIRLLLGYKHANYQAVTIPVIMPKPDLLPLTGGYRRTPVMQLGADIYCDTSLIARVIDELLPDGTIYPPGNEATVAATARWTDSVFFRTCISVAFQPRALAESPLFQDQAAAEAFLRDRAELAGGASLTLPPETALPLFHNHLGNLDRQLAGSAFLFGNQPTEADFSSYHCCWFVHQNAALAGEFDHYPNLRQWMSVMREFGHGELETISGEEALDAAAAVSPRVAEGQSLEALDGLRPGEQVEVMPTDYGFDPVRGVLMQSSVEHLSLLREDPRVGTVAVHFPRVGYQVTRAADKG
ncbi:glutathione S-transferase family protein [Pseudohaliea sp.]|uniref:glutathione S-transferase family protein n=1 Tax=Pseudohaliea sp. TaxID=2740289 RepID=UPI0032ED4D6F